MKEKERKREGKRERKKEKREKEREKERKKRVKVKESEKERGRDNLPIFEGLQQRKEGQSILQNIGCQPVGRGPLMVREKILVVLREMSPLPKTSPKQLIQAAREHKAAPPTWPMGAQGLCCLHCEQHEVVKEGRKGGGTCPTCPTCLTWPLLSSAFGCTTELEMVQKVGDPCSKTPEGRTRSNG
ncbi:E3 ubiquitin-protein ligase BRE1A, partial [Ophiophagus hannah]